MGATGGGATLDGGAKLRRVAVLATIACSIVGPAHADAQTTTEVPTTSTSTSTPTTTTTTTPSVAPTTTEVLEPTTSLPFATTIPPPVVIPPGAVNGSLGDPPGTPPPPPPAAPEAQQPGPTGIPPGLTLAIALREPGERRVSAAIRELELSQAALGDATRETEEAAAALAESQATVDGLDAAERDAAARGAETRAELRDASVAAYVSGSAHGSLTVALGAVDITDAQARLTYFDSINDDLRRSADTWERSRSRLSDRSGQAAERHGQVIARVQWATDARSAATARWEAAQAELGQATTAAGVAPSLVPGIPDRVLDAYVRAAQLAAFSDPGCRIRWWGLAAIGRTESGHAGGRAIGADGKVSPAILGPVLDGAGPFARIADTDGGVLDGNTTYDRALGPTQFIPSTWRSLGLDASGDGVADPQNIYDSAYSTARYLCAAARPLPMDTEAGFLDAAYSYSHSSTYPRASWDGSALYRSLASAAQGSR
ncbi:MAG TPA: lytic murein transglycosylase [Microthrixaceae bacterium]|nr:lytic murein transglycosylase [Microthrixaceae bacterium]